MTRRSPRPESHEYFVIPKKAPTNEHGFVLLPVDPLKQRRRDSNLCLMCGSHCQPDVHHAYWPGPVKNADQAEDRRRNPRFNRLPDYRIDSYRRLREAPFSISKPICRSWHVALHNLQQPPRELPDRLILETALEQYERIRRATAKSNIVATLLKHQGDNIAKLTHEEHILSALVGDLPPEESVVFPTIGYYCMRDDLDTTRLHDDPLTFHITRNTARITRVLSGLRNHLS